MNDMDHMNEEMNLTYTEAYSAQWHLGAYDERVTETPDISTGYPGLDALIDGGLLPGMYVIGADSSLGKTSFCLQLADQVAESGRDVLFISIEMSTDQLIAKSLSRQTYRRDLQLGSNGEHAVTARGMLSQKKRKLFTAKMWNRYYESFMRYREDVAPHLFIFERTGDMEISKVQDIVENHIYTTGRRPLVIVDRLQSLAALDPRFIGKQNMESTSLILKGLSMNFGLPVICISSLNQESYAAPVSPASFEDGEVIERSFDVLIGLQYAGIDLSPGESEADRQTRVQDLYKCNEELAAAGESVSLELKLLKNRMGKKGSCLFRSKVQFVQ